MTEKKRLNTLKSIFTLAAVADAGAAVDPSPDELLLCNAQASKDRDKQEVNAKLNFTPTCIWHTRTRIYIWTPPNVGPSSL